MAANEEIIPPWLIRAISIVLYVVASIFAVLTIATWAVLLVNLVGVTSWPRPIGIAPAVTVVGFTIVINCLFLWFMNKVSILKLDPTTVTTIGRTIIWGTLGSAAALIGTSFTK